jgi:alkylhydroperoxidase/carboxymuconolactone decarboxylase family protein YurZ
MQETPSLFGGALRRRFHVKAAVDRGATREETLETLDIAIYMRAEPACDACKPSAQRLHAIRAEGGYR